MYKMITTKRVCFLPTRLFWFPFSNIFICSRVFFVRAAVVNCLRDPNPAGPKYIVYIVSFVNRHVVHVHGFSYLCILLYCFGLGWVLLIEILIGSHVQSQPQPQPPPRPQPQPQPQSEPSSGTIGQLCACRGIVIRYIGHCTYGSNSRWFVFRWFDFQKCHASFDNSVSLNASTQQQNLIKIHITHRNSFSKKHYNAYHSLTAHWLNTNACYWYVSINIYCYMTSEDA